MLAGTLVAGLARPVLHSTVPPLFLGFAAVIIMIVIARILNRKTLSPSVEKAVER